MDYNPTDFKDKPDLSTPLRAVELNKFGAGIVEGITKAELALPLVDTAANLAASNPIPAVGRGVRESDTGRWKTGDGTTHYNDLPYDPSYRKVIAGIAAPTATALGVGSVELGHASDTTLSRSAAGVLAVGGVAVPTVSSTDDLSNKNVLTALNAQTASYTLVLADKGKAVEVTSASATNVTVPPNSSVDYPIGTVIEVAQLGTGQVTLVAGEGVTLQTPSSLLTRAQFSSLSLRKRATDTWLVTGDMQ